MAFAGIEGGGRWRRLPRPEGNGQLHAPAWRTATSVPLWSLTNRVAQIGPRPRGSDGGANGGAAPAVAGAAVDESAANCCLESYSDRALIHSSEVVADALAGGEMGLDQIGSPCMFAMAPTTARTTHSSAALRFAPGRVMSRPHPSAGDPGAGQGTRGVRHPPQRA